MSTYDVPGHNKSNNDQLAMGCWAEHTDGSYIFVESTEGNRVIYCLFDTSQTPIVEYRDAMMEDDFKKQFSWKSGKSVADLKWTWHDKTAFPWDKIIKAGAKPGPKYASAVDQITAAQKVADALSLKANTLTDDALDTIAKERGIRRVMKLAKRLQDAISQLGTGA